MYDEVAESFDLFAERFPLRQHRAADRGLSPYVLRRVEFHQNDFKLEATYESVLNALSWNPLFNGFHADRRAPRKCPARDARQVQVRARKASPMGTCVSVVSDRLGELEDMPVGLSLATTFVWQADAHERSRVRFRPRRRATSLRSPIPACASRPPTATPKTRRECRRPVDHHGDANHFTIPRIREFTRSKILRISSARDAAPDASIPREARETAARRSSSTRTSATSSLACRCFTPCATRIDSGRRRCARQSVERIEIDTKRGEAQTVTARTN